MCTKCIHLRIIEICFSSLFLFTEESAKLVMNNILGPLSRGIWRGNFYGVLALEINFLCVNLLRISLA